MDKNLLKLCLSGMRFVCELHSWVLQYKNISIHQKWDIIFFWVIVGTFICLSVLLNLLWEILVWVSHRRSASLPWL